MSANGLMNTGYRFKNSSFCFACLFSGDIVILSKEEWWRNTSANVRYGMLWKAVGPSTRVRNLERWTGAAKCRQRDSM